jgi:hypothetical protein
MTRTAKLTLLTMLIIQAGCRENKQTYDAGCSNHPTHFGTAKDGIGHLLPYVRVEVDASGGIKWAGTAISEDQLQSFARAANSLDTVPQLIVDPAPLAPCERVKRVRAILLASPICQRGHFACSEGRDPKNWPVVGGP